jgi:hypothetical protein
LSEADVLIFPETTDLSGLLASLARAAPELVVKVPSPADIILFLAPFD